MENQKCIFFRKPSSNRSNIRKRSTQQESSESEPENPNPSNKPNKNSSNKKLLFSTTSKPAPKPESEPDNPLSSSSSFYFESSKEIQTHHDSRATATLETETDFSNDARAIRERALKRAEANLRARPSGSAGRPEAAAAEEKVYKGIHSYTDYKAGFRREQTVAGEKAGGAHGPLRASAHIRTSARFDYQPDICKDYKETGYCGFGDACKFMHDRGDYKSGWQMEKEWEEKEKARKRALAMGGGGDDEDNNNDDDDDSDEDALPFACFICRQPFEDPVVTKCKHYFCEHCALKHHSKNKKCFVCNKPTLGIFNTAHEIRKRMAQEK
ncbi:zinc finger CCCH domain-containing protein 15-like [Iris pallida]|uniref:Zinc finger CCCH domain-containing protein 15-like n=1 Tax=Iris pallida TaxID=29817 RepID=A0AAX6HJN9_IRIPA|nr:zinc finger CCCH domain-containing protein 15-like [Iris pallida]